MSRKSTIAERGYDDVSLEEILTEFGSAGNFSDSKKKPVSDTIKEKKQKPEQNETEFDSRFHIGGSSRSFSGNNRYKLDLSADENYVPPVSNSGSSELRQPPPGDVPFEVSPESRGSRPKNNKGISFQPKYEAEIETEEPSEKKTAAEKLRGFFSSSRHKEKTEEEEDAFESNEKDKPEGYFPASFGEYLASLFAAFLLKIRGFSRADVAETMADDDEDLGSEVNVRFASEYYRSFVRSSKLRLEISLALLAILIYISLGFPLPGMLKVLSVNAGLCLALQLTIMMLSLDIVTNGFLKLFRLRPGADSLAVICCILTSVDAAMVLSSNTGVAHPPMCALSSLSLVGILFSQYLSVRGLRQALRVPSIAKVLYAVIGENNLAGKEITLIKTSRTAAGFVRRAEEAAPDEILFEKLAPFALAVCLLFSIIISAVTGNIADFIYIFSAVLCPCVPFCALLCFSLPFSLGTAKLFRLGASIAGWSGLCDVGQSKNIIVTDTDLFPPNNISVETIRIFADEDARKVISYAGSLIFASGSSMAKAFLDEMAQNGCDLLPVANFEPLSGGGFKGQIEGRTVLCGSADLMRLMNVKLPFRLLDKTTVLLAIDGVLFGIFTMKYTADAGIRKALVGLLRTSRHPVFAIRDFNVTPNMIKELFDISTDGYDFPPFIERFKMTAAKPSEDCRTAAVVCREGLGTLTAMAAAGRGMYVASRLNLIITVIGSPVCMLTVFIKLLAGSVSMNFILLLMLLISVPVFVISALLT